MKTRIILLLSTFISFYAAAQPTVTQNEFYHIGDVINMIQCDTAGVHTDSTGSSVTWDYSGLMPSGSNYTMTVLADTSTIFLTANLMILLPGGVIEYMRENSTNSYINGIQTATGVQTTYTNLSISQRPMTYLDTYTDTYTVNTPSTGMYSHGYIVVTADGYGTLKSPTGVYDNVLRIKKFQYEIDTTGTTYVLSSATTYQFFDTMHAAPLLEIDMNPGGTTIGMRIMYLDTATTPTAVNNVSKTQDNITCNITNDELYLNGDITSGNRYSLELYNAAGAKVVSTNFTATAGTQHIYANTRIAPGIYVATLKEEGKSNNTTVIKTVKQ